MGRRQALGETQSRDWGEQGAKWGDGGSRMVLGAGFQAQTTTSTDSTTPKEGSMTVLNMTLGSLNIYFDRTYLCQKLLTADWIDQ